MPTLTKALLSCVNPIGIMDLREKSPCSCCSNDSKFVLATKSPVAFQKAVCCEKIKFLGLELPHSPDFIAEFTPFKCVVDDKLPPHKGVETCQTCGLKGIVPLECPVMRSLSQEKVCWSKRIETPYKTKKDEWSTKVVYPSFYDSLAVDLHCAVSCIVESFENPYRYALGIVE